MKGMRVRLHVDFMVLPVIVMSALFDVLTSILSISGLLLGYSALLAAELKDVPKDRGVFIFQCLFFLLLLVGLLEVEDEGTTIRRNVDRCTYSVFRHTQHLMLTR